MPIHIAIACWLVLGEKLSLFEVLCLLTSFSGVVCLIFGAQSSSDPNKQSSYYAYIVMIFALLSIAFVAITLRQTKKMNPWVPSFYSLVFGLPLFLLLTWF